MGGLPGVRGVAVDLAAGKVRVDGQPNADQVRAAIVDEGYQVHGA